MLNAVYGRAGKKKKDRYSNLSTVSTNTVTVVYRPTPETSSIPSIEENNGNNVGMRLALQLQSENSEMKLILVLQRRYSRKCQVFLVCAYFQN